VRARACVCLYLSAFVCVCLCVCVCVCHRKKLSQVLNFSLIIFAVCHNHNTIHVTCRQHDTTIATMHTCTPGMYAHISVADGSSTIANMTGDMRKKIKSRFVTRLVLSEHSGNVREK
jgi:anaerobic C4-dicarboxylate transporter